MSRTDRLQTLVGLLRTDGWHRASELAQRLGVTERTIYRDMDTLRAAGVPVEGTRGSGYRATGETVLPPLRLSAAEFEALNLGIAIIAGAGDARLAEAAASLGDKIDAALPAETMAKASAWDLPAHPFADSARILGTLPTLQNAIRVRQKVALTCNADEGPPQSHVLRPLHLEVWGRIWTLTAFSETTDAFVRLRLDLIDTARALPELFSDEPGKSLRDLPVT